MKQFSFSVPPAMAEALSKMNTHKPTIHDIIPIVPDTEANEIPGLQAAMDAGLKPFKGTVTRNGTTVPVEWYEVDEKGLIYGTKPADVSTFGPGLEDNFK